MMNNALRKSNFWIWKFKRASKYSRRFNQVPVNLVGKLKTV